jgi:hypothetical protein
VVCFSSGQVTELPRIVSALCELRAETHEEGIERRKVGGTGTELLPTARDSAANRCKSRSDSLRFVQRMPQNCAKPQVGHPGGHNPTSEIRAGELRRAEPGVQIQVAVVGLLVKAGSRSESPAVVAPVLTHAVQNESVSVRPVDERL